MNYGRGDILLIDLDPTQGSEIKKTRPGVVVSNDVANRFSRLITIVPLTSQGTEKIYPQEVLIPKGKGLSFASKAKVSQIRAVDRSRIKSKLGKVGNFNLKEIDQALRLHLAIW